MSRVMDGSKVLEIRGIDPTLFYRIGVKGVTRIESMIHSSEAYCESYSYSVFKGKAIYATVNDAAIAEIIYDQQEQEQDNE